MASGLKWFQMLALVIATLLIASQSATAQPTDPAAPPPPADEKTAPEKVDVAPVAADGQIEKRLTDILNASGWFQNPSVKVRDSIVFLSGEADSNASVKWAGDLARKTESVVAVVNKLKIDPGSAWNFTPALEEIGKLGRETIRAIPLILFAIVVLALAWFVMGLLKRAIQPMLVRRFQSPLLGAIAASAIAIPIFLIGVYLVLQVAGLTRLALTVLGGTGLIGLVVGFAFRDIAENFLASVLLSIRQPFARDDLIEVAGHHGTVQQMNTRSTVLMTFDGNHVLIPNATIFKSTIVNFTANPLRRDTLTVGIGYDDAVSEAQEIVARVLRDHPAVAATPAPMVLVESLGASTINLAAYYWYDGKTYSEIKTRSALLRLAKKALIDAGISMPDEAREVIFPNGVPVEMQGDGAQTAPGTHAAQDLQTAQSEHNKASVNGADATSEESEAAATDAEGALTAENADLSQQASRAEKPEGSEDLLRS